MRSGQQRRSASGSSRRQRCSGPGPGRVPAALRLSMACLCGCALLIVQPGCGGCRPDAAAKKKAEEERKKKEEEEKKKKKKPNFESARVSLLPRDDVLRNYVKPGHWMSATQQMRANNFDFVGQLDTACVSSDGRPLALEKTRYHLRLNRPVSLPKGQAKRFELLYFAPPPEVQSTQAMWLQSRLVTARGGRPVFPQNSDPTTRLKPHQYFMVVLARRSDDYGYLKALHSVNPPRADFSSWGLEVDYVVVLPRGDGRVGLPGNPLTWTSIAYVVWDDFDPSVLSRDQQQAMVDWLHWGGQLIVSGPNTLALLEGSFLAPYLPARVGKTGAVRQAALDPINDKWAVQNAKTGETQRLQAGEARPLEVIQFRPHAETQSIPRTGELVCERRVGRGRIVATAFALGDRRIVNWDGFDNFFNGCLLRRPARRYQIKEGTAALGWAEFPDRQFDARLTSDLRYFSHDSATSSAVSKGFRSDARTGVAGWSDFSGVCEAARASLTRAAGITVPDPRFILNIMAVYLAILVPVNWGLFRLMGRVEWAWVAVPAIAVGGAAMVVKLAQLDIGFARSRTELAVVEAQSGHDRGHLTRYVGLYTSLSSTYDVTCEDDAALILPFAIGKEGASQLSSRQTVTLHRDKQARLSGLRVMSNSTGMVHAEQMMDLGGTIRIEQDSGGGQRVINDSSYSLRGAGVVRRSASGVETAWIGDLPAKTGRPAPFTSTSTDFPQWNQDPGTSLSPPEGEVGLRGLLVAAAAPEQMRPGDIRLVGWTDEEIPGVTVRPRSSQQTFRTLLLAHLKYGPWPEPSADVNSKPVVAEVSGEGFDLTP